MISPKNLYLHFYEPRLEVLYSQIDELIENGHRNFLLVPQNETSKILMQRFHEKKNIVFNTAQKITDSSSQAVIVITEANADLVSEHLLNCHHIKSGIVLTPITKHHYSNRSLYISCIPKSGTHMLIKMLEVMGIQSNSSSLPCNGKWNIIPEYSYHAPCKKFIEEQFSNAMLPMGKHPIFQSPVIFMYRNPLDIIISELSWFTKLSEVWSHYLNNFEDIDSKLLALIESPLLGNIRERMLNYIDWLDFSNVTPVSYEELVGSQGGGSDKEQIKTIWSIQLKLHIHGSPQEIASKIYDVNSPTFAKGKISRHKKLFKELHYKKFMSLPQDFMEKMGYDFDAVFSKYVEHFRQRPLKIWEPSIDELWEQRLIKGSFYGFNIIYAGGQYIVLDQSIGGIDLSIEANRTQDGVYTGFGSYKDAVAFVIIKECGEKIQAGISGRDMKMEALQCEAAERDSTIEGLRKDIEDKEAEILKLQTEIADRDSRIEALKGEAAERDSTIERQRKDLEDREASIVKLQAEISDRNLKIEALQNELTHIKASLWFRLFKGVKRSDN